MIRASVIPLLLAPIAFAQPDPVIEKAREAADSFAQTLPNYFCQQVTTRFVSATRAMRWRQVDVISAEVIYENGREHYRNVTLSGRPVKRGMEELGGAWSTGEFGTQLWDLFTPKTAAQFALRKEASSHGVTVAIYDYQVQRANSHWGLMVGDKLVYTNYEGSVWIEKESGRVLRLERRAYNVPREIQLDKVDTAISYEYVRIGSAQRFLLPARSEMVLCQRGSNNCNKNEIDFRSYRKYSGEASISFDQ